MRSPLLAGLIGFIVGFGLAFFVGVIVISDTPGGIALPPAQAVVGGVAYAPLGWKTLDVGGTSYRLSYPRDFDLAFNASEGSYLGGGTKIAFPQDAFSDGPRSNYSEGWITISSSRAPKDVAGCLSKVSSPREKMTEAQQLGGTTFMVDRLGDAAAGNFYESTVRRAIVSGECLEVTTTLHTTNVGNYDPGTVVEFDKTKAEALFDAALDTLTVTANPQ
jgi:hypothetical protein